MEIRNSRTNDSEQPPDDVDRANVSSVDASTAPRLTEKDIVGLKYFDQLLPLFERLHDDGCGRDQAGNRVLHYDQ